MKFHAFGDSFVVGDQDDFDLPESGSYDDRLEYLKNNVSFAALIASDLGLDFINYADRGSGNYPQLDKLVYNVLCNKILPGDIVFFGLTTVARDRWSLGHHKILDINFGPSMADRELFRNDIQSINELDYFYILSVLEKISISFNLRINALNLFDNPLLFSNKNRSLFKSSVLIDCHDSGRNTLVDIINDTWGIDINIKYSPDHTTLKTKVPTEYKQYYTRQSHPSISAHRKVADWLLKNIYNHG
jgi:hypothetical protein